MKSVTTHRFRVCFKNLSIHIQELANKSYKLWKQNPAHPSVQFKRVHTTMPVFSARVGLSYRTLGISEGDTIIWFWIGDHDQYIELLKTL